jgi:GNAT superfamily N-acetyltransferase
MQPSIPETTSTSHVEVERRTQALVTSCTARNLTANDLDAAKRLFVKDQDWGEYYGGLFRQEAESIIARPPSAVKGLFLSDGSLAAVGVVEKAGFDFAYWTLTWVMVDNAYRGQGLGRAIIDTLIEHAKREQSVGYRNQNCRILISAVLDQAQFYAHYWGFKPLMEGPLQGEQLMGLDAKGPFLPLPPLQE